MVVSSCVAACRASRRHHVLLHEPDEHGILAGSPCASTIGKGPSINDEAAVFQEM